MLRIVCSPMRKTIKNPSKLCLAAYNSRSKIRKIYGSGFFRTPE